MADRGSGPEREREHAFLLAFSNIIREQADETSIATTCVSKLGEFFRADRVYLSEMSSDTVRITIEHRRRDLSPLVGGYPLPDYPELVARIRNGPFVVPDIDTDMTLSEDSKASIRGGGLQAIVAVHLYHGDQQPIWAVTIGTSTPRQWTTADVILLQDVAERTWAAIERARGHAERRRTEDLFRSVLDGMGEAFGLMDHEMRIITQNPEALRLDGRQLDEIRGRTHWEVYPGSEDSELGRLYKRALADGVPVSHEHHYEYPNGGEAWLEMRAYPVAEGLAVFWRDISDRKRAELALQQAHDSLEQRVRERTTQVQSLFERLVTVQEDERRRIARDIHDHLGQQMTALRMNLEVLRAQAAPHPECLAQVERTMQRAEELDRSIDHLAWELRPSALDHLGFAAALEQLVTGWSERFGIAADLAISDPDMPRLPQDKEAQLYRLAQEALHNVFKHAHASRVSVFLGRRDGELLFIIEDNGRGFVVDDVEPAAGRSRIGLITMRERAELIGARLTIESEPARGTSLFVRLPISTGIS